MYFFVQIVCKLCANCVFFVPHFSFHASFLDSHSGAVVELCGSCAGVVWRWCGCCVGGLVSGLVSGLVGAGCSVQDN